MTKITAVVAFMEDRGMGNKGALPWPKISGDLKHFKEKTEGGTVVMGRKTLISIGKALPNRRNIVLSKSSDISMEGVEFASSIKQVLSMVHGAEEVFIIGGAEIYKRLLNYTDEIDALVIKKRYKCDVFFPAYHHLFHIKESKDVAYKNELGEDIACERKTLVRKSSKQGDIQPKLPPKKVRGFFI